MVLGLKFVHGNYGADQPFFYLRFINFAVVANQDASASLAFRDYSLAVFVVEVRVRLSRRTKHSFRFRFLVEREERFVQRNMRKKLYDIALTNFRPWRFVQFSWQSDPQLNE